MSLLTPPWEVNLLSDSALNGVFSHYVTCQRGWFQEILINVVVRACAIGRASGSQPPLFIGIKTSLKDKIFEILSVFSMSLHRHKDLFFDAQEIWEDLSRRGYSEEEIEGALSHIERTSLNVPGAFWSDTVPIYRFYTDDEKQRLPTRVRGYLWKLKCRGVIDHALEDEIVHKAMHLEEPAGIREIKTVAALTIFGYEHKTQNDHGSSGLCSSRIN